MLPDRPLPPSLSFLEKARLTDHHCRGVLRAGGNLESLLTEGDGGAAAGGTAFDSLAGLSFRRWCPPVLGLEPHAPLAEYAKRREELGLGEVSWRFLTAAGLGALCVDTGDGNVTSPGETAACAGARAFEIVRLEQVAETLAAQGVSPPEFPDAFRHALSERAAGQVEVIPGAEGMTGSFVPVVAVKSVAACRAGLDLRGERPAFSEVENAAERWLRGTGRSGARTRSGAPRLADETLHRFLIWCAADLGLPIQFHAGYGDRGLDLHKSNPLLLTGLLRALEPAGVPVVLLNSYPYHREAGYLAQVFPHVYADLGPAIHNLGRRATAVLAEALELAPLRKFLYSSGGSGLPELHYLGSLQFRRAFGAFLNESLTAGDLNLDDAERLAGLITSGNAARVYQLPDEPGVTAGRSDKK